ncbi:MAG: hypothetical protein A3B99_03395 [Candidatus Yanofskybacteria bacterium RIFCSPHIGHO2_02_FULL_44_12b]|uniref:CBS domain-containing protein n=2 Tax=Candidatus Yanofskyibacteriota TaxID=1752733 RepID=A0A1F8GLW4_9BACT|nr:MAG: hypothetical protein A2659_02595 [Candidatus Yanofskybacteria bacterium RIFCSPHIGHO2_01_FULL_44_24]OGN13969.1 MAG: hypothetical protein A3B99_03395 [Candidatus Yanofskybacteria bacterium RIFCSPHIGHO2_02_FULL_44_12b]OGN26333.1 MAG: hypothetical protein A2925_00370 [Candidatus Yanofskybacteria bacterium RIFCSPLOWO2_01_FULL_44_22]
MTSVKEIMVTKIVSVKPDDLLRNAVDVLLANGFNGLPVLDEDGVLIGILTEFDVIVAGTSIHSPALKRINENPDFYKNKNLMKDDVSRILGMKVKEVMNTEPFVVKEDASVEEIMKNFSDHHRINPIPVIDENRHVLGIVSRYDVIKFTKKTISELADKIK